MKTEDGTAAVHRDLRSPAHAPPADPGLGGIIRTPVQVNIFLHQQFTGNRLHRIRGITGGSHNAYRRMGAVAGTAHVQRLADIDIFGFRTVIRLLNIRGNGVLVFWHNVHHRAVAVHDIFHAVAHLSKYACNRAICRGIDLVRGNGGNYASLINPAACPQAEMTDRSAERRCHGDNLTGYDGSLKCSGCQCQHRHKDQCQNDSD